MKKRIASIILCLVLLVSLSVPAFAKNKVDSIEVYATIQEDGSVYITQLWDGEFTDGTENYIPMNAPDYLTISDLKVTDINGTYETVEDWDVDWSFKEKAGKCGINYTKLGYEICFGISEYGENRYEIEYKLDNVIGSYDEADGVNFRFVNDDMNTTPTDVRVEIRLGNGKPINDSNADIWAFGFKGQVEFSDGAIIAYTEKPITSDNHVTVMFALDKGLVSPARVENTSFGTVKERAFEGSDYDSDDDSDAIAYIIIFTVISIIIICTVLIVVMVMIDKKKMREFVSKTGYFRSVPNEGDINGTYSLGTMFKLCAENSILATNMLKLIDLGCLTPITDEEVGFFGRTKEEVNLHINKIDYSIMNEQERKLYSILERAAGEDGVLQAKELKKFAEKHDKILRSYIDECAMYGNDYLSKKGCMKSWTKPSNLKYLTPSGEKELSELIGFKKYLEDFSLVAEREIKEIPIWKDLLLYAMLFGIADKLAEQMKELYPAISEEVEVYTRTIYTAHSYHYILYSNMIASEQRRIQEQRSSGSGGHSSFGGGGGSIGGGSGGGSR